VVSKINTSRCRVGSGSLSSSAKSVIDTECNVRSELMIFASISSRSTRLNADDRCRLFQVAADWLIQGYAGCIHMTRE
jgi:hypothetical protein